MRNAAPGAHRLHVSIGELKVGVGNDVLFATLGSCVGIGVLWPEHNRFGLAHCLLPEPGELLDRAHSLDLGARYVSLAVPALLHLLAVPPHSRHELAVVVAGGGNMTAPADTRPERLVGTLNVRAAVTHLGDAGLRIQHSEVGGNVGRKLTINCSTGEFDVQTIPRLIPED